MWPSRLVSGRATLPGLLSPHKRASISSLLRVQTATSHTARKVLARTAFAGPIGAPETQKLITSVGIAIMVAIRRI
jgi:hypothetical protein